jgi:hypothetical protein
MGLGLPQLEALLTVNNASLGLIHSEVFMSEPKQQFKDPANRIIRDTALWLAALLGPDMDGAQCIYALQQVAKGVEKSDEEGSPVFPLKTKTKRVRAAAYVTPSGNWTVFGCPNGEEPYGDKEMVEELFAFYPSGEDDIKFYMVDIDLPLPVHNSTEVIQAAGVEEVAE